MIIYGRNVIITAIEAKQKIQELWVSKTANGPVIKKIQHICRTNDIPVFEKPSQAIDKKAGSGVVHQGVIGFTKGFDYVDLNRTLNDLDLSDGLKLILVLDQINDPHNLGAIIRTAECAGVSAIIIPSQNSAQVTSTVMKVSAGAVFYLPIIRVKTVEEAILTLKDKHFNIITTDGEATSTLYDIDYDTHCALIIGNEGTGIRNKIIKLSDHTINIPIHGRTESLNASVAAGICMYHIKEKQVNK